MKFISKIIFSFVCLCFLGFVANAQVKQATTPKKTSTSAPVSKAKTANASIKKPSVKKSPLKKVIKPLEVGDVYKGGVIYELYGDGSGGKVVFKVVKLDYNSSQRALKDNYENGIKCYMASDYDLQKLFQLGYIGPDAGDGTWNHLWFMGERRMASYGYPYALTAENILNLSSDSNERIARIVSVASKIDRYEGKLYWAMVGIFSFNK